MDHIPQQTGFLVINEDGGVISSGGDLENDERVAAIILAMVRVGDRTEIGAEHFRRMTINYDDHLYAVALNNKKIHVVRRKYLPTEPVLA